LKKLKQKRTETFIKNYGYSHPSQSQQVKEKIKETNIKNCGFSTNLKSQSTKEKIKQTNLEKYGSESHMQNEKIKEKIKNTNLMKYGCKYPIQNLNIKNKIINSYILKYGTEHPSQNAEIAEKISKSCYSKKMYTLPSGKNIHVQGYEPFALDCLIQNEQIKEEDIVLGCKNVPTIWYNDELGKKHRHYVDIFIPSLNKCIEVKSTWTAKKKKDCIFLKQKVAKELGYYYEIWIYDRKGNRIEIYN